MMMIYYKRHNRCCHCYADETQLYTVSNSLDPVDLEISKIRLTPVSDLNQRMIDNNLKLNRDESKLLILSSSFGLCACWR